MTIRGIIFDLDGTLANTLPLCVEAFQNTFEHFHCSRPDKAQILATFGPSEDGILERGIPVQLDESLAYFLGEYERLHGMCPQPFTGVERIFTLLEARQIPAAIVTGKGPGSAAISMRVLGLENRIDILEPGFPDRMDKPSAIRKVLARWNLAPEEVAYVGDMLYDMQASHEVGLLPLGAAWAETNELSGAPDSKAALTFERIEDFIGWVEKL